MSEVSVLYIHGIIITVNKNRDTLLDGALLVTNNRISDIGNTVDLLGKYQGIDKIHDLENSVVIPGLINAHAHLIQSLMRGLAEDMNLHAWMCDAIWPMEANYKGDDGYWAAKLAMTEMLKTGTTCFLEPMLPSTAGFEKVVKAMEDTGIRGCLGKLLKTPKPNIAAGISDARDENASDMTVGVAISEYETFNGALNDRVHVWFAGETPRGADEGFYKSIGLATKKHNIPLTIHVAEVKRDQELIRECYQTSPAQFLEKNGLTGPRTVLAHMCHLDLDVDLEILKRTETSVVHNPTSNCKLGDGIAAIPEMLAAGINVALGTDGAPCSNTYDLFRDMHLAGILHKGHRMDASVLPAEQVLEMATINGARALGLENEIGSLEVGKKADFVVVNVESVFGAAPFAPDQVGKGGMHPVTAIVHSCTGNDVKMVVVDGKVLVEDGLLTVADEMEVLKNARGAIIEIRKRSGVQAQPLKMGWRYL